MSGNGRIRVWAATGLAAVSTSLFLLTLVRRDWIEAVFGFEGDHDGSVEWTITSLLLAASVVLTLVARAEWRRRNAPATKRMRNQANAEE
jgi:hypothetical protein